MLDVTGMFISALIFALLGYATFLLVGLDINKLIGAFGLLQFVGVFLVKTLPLMLNPCGITPEYAEGTIVWMVTYLADNIPSMVISDLAGYTAGIIVGMTTQVADLMEGVF